MDETQKKRIMVIDDDLGILEALRFMLESSGYEVGTVSRGDEVMRSLGEFRPDIILLDLYLSGYDGRDIAAQIKSAETGADVPIVMISAHPSAGESVKESPVDDFLPKPFDVAQLLGIIDKHVSNA